ncbi:MAG: Holliday junction branch migration protein RuvA [Ruminococcus sp.]|jgi:Holliday junction DNA helicase RuvA|nr:Holliday junction branch migration protein RuvA [Ruminococcus sp.]
MINSLNGKVIKKTDDMAVIECGGVGYGCRCSLNTLSAVTAVGGTQFLYTYMHITENALDLFGFTDERELSCFQLLISVSRVGPKMALAVLSMLTPERFALAVASEDVNAFRGIKGVGAKNASRIILELKDKLKKESGDLSEFAHLTLPKTEGKGSNASEAVAALTVLGFSQSEAIRAVSGLSVSMSAQDMIKTALKMLSKI